MVVQHNLTAMNSNRMLNITTKSQAKSTEKLSSGYKINRAADDAAGLAISEKMRKQMRGLTQASANAQDGISSVQTAEGALNEVQDMLQRINELAVKAANGTNSKDDRAYIQAEVDQLVTEIDRVSTTTKFNETYLLKGRNADGTAGKLSYITASTVLGGDGVTDDLFNTDGTIKEPHLGTAAGTTTTTVANIKTLTDAEPTEATTAVTITEITANGKTYQLLQYAPATDEKLTEDDLVKAYKAKNATAIDAGTLSVATTLDELSEQIKLDSKGELKSVKVEMIADGGADDGKLSLTATAFADLNEAIDLSLHVGADSSKDNKIGLQIQMMSARYLEVNGLRVDGDTDENATAAIDAVAAALQKVSSQRSTLGAIQNRLEHTIANLDNIVENTTSAESAIRDTDMATEMVTYSNNNILAQAGQAMLAQANQSNQGVLSLLQG